MERPATSEKVIMAKPAKEELVTPKHAKVKGN
jgi:hypothetical protein